MAVGKKTQNFHGVIANSKNSKRETVYKIQFYKTEMPA